MGGDVLSLCIFKVLWSTDWHWARVRRHQSNVAATPPDVRRNFHVWNELQPSLDACKCTSFTCIVEEMGNPCTLLLALYTPARLWNKYRRDMVYWNSFMIGGVGVACLDRSLRLQVCLLVCLWSGWKSAGSACWSPYGSLLSGGWCRDSNLYGTESGLGNLISTAPPTRGFCKLWSGLFTSTMQDPEKVIETVDCVMRCWIIICVIRKVPLVHYCLVSQTLSVPQCRSLESDRRCGTERVWPWII